MQRVIGLMSGTSMDGIDAAWIETDGEAIVRAGPSLTLRYDDGFKRRLRASLGADAPADLEPVEAVLTELHGEAVRKLRDRHGLPIPDLVGFHGHTVLHRPAERRTRQIGDGAMLARLTGAPVAFDFRTADVLAGGEGAPLAPAFHRALASGLERPVAILNLGGVGNLTWLGSGPDDLIAFDTGPGNALIDDWVRRHDGDDYDADGALARAGQVDEAFVARFLAADYFRAPPPKSLDRDEFAPLVPDHLSPADGAATLTRITAASVALALGHLPARPRAWYVTGGGRHNPAIMAELAAALAAPVAPVEALGWDGDALEAQAFAYLAVRTLKGLPISFPGTTRAPHPMAGGRVVYPTA